MASLSKDETQGCLYENVPSVGVATWIPEWEELRSQLPSAQTAVLFFVFILYSLGWLQTHSVARDDPALLPLLSKYVYTFYIQVPQMPPSLRSPPPYLGQMLGLSM